jgi:hypothetical protein
MFQTTNQIISWLFLILNCHKIRWRIISPEAVYSAPFFDHVRTVTMRNASPKACIEPVLYAK